LLISVKDWDLKKKWVKAFLDAMEMDLVKNRYHKLEETLAYMYGSAEVVGLMMAKILNLDPASYPFARLLGRSMQYANFIRDFAEDKHMNRIYFPLEDLCSDKIDSKNLDKISQRPEFTNFIRCQINNFEKWQMEAEKGFKFIPKRYLIPIKTASDMYKWTVAKIKKTPTIVLTKKIKPSVFIIISSIFKNALSIS